MAAESDIQSQQHLEAFWTGHDGSTVERTMASKFFHVHHEFRAGKSQQWWDTAQAAMAPGGGWDEAVAKNLEAGFPPITLFGI